MTAVLERPDIAPAKCVDGLSAIVEVGECLLYRAVYPDEGAAIAEVVAAMKTDERFLNPSENSGVLTTREGNRLVVLAHWNTWEREGFDAGELIEVTTSFDDGTSENITF